MRSGATGLFQIMWPLHRGIVPGATSQQALMDPGVNIAAAQKLYQQSGLAPWLASRHVWGKQLGPGQGDGWGMRAPEWGGWHAKGGAFTAHRPTLIGVGEAGAERVTIKPQAAKSSSGRKYEFHFHGDIINKEPGDIEKIVKRELAAVAADLERLDDEDELG
jgi:hypothetical protein